jgi:ABC-type uncharacterized transport system involved in gliding motility auxiliary subunit
MATTNLGSSKTRFGASAGLYTLIVIAALGLVNWLADHYNKTYDTTANKRYTLSNETKKVIGGLKNDVTITYFDSPEHFETAKTMLDRYHNLSPRIRVQYIDYRKQLTLARSYGLRFPGTAFVESGPKREEAKAMTEEGITGAFLKVLKESRKVCFVTGSHERQLDETGAAGLSKLKDMLARDNYTVDTIPLLAKNEIPKDCAVVVVAGPRNDYEPATIATIKSYVEGGGRAFILLDPPLNVGKVETGENQAFTQLLSTWGVTTGKDLILDPAGQVVGMGPEVPLITDFETHPIVKDLKNGAVALPYSQSLEVKNGDNTTVEKILTTAPRTIALTKLTGEKIKLDDPKNKKGPFVIGAAGTLKSSDPAKAGRYVVIGSASFLENEYIGIESNRDLAVNSINWLSSDEDLITIRPKEADDRRLDMRTSQLNVFQWTVLVGIPLIIIAMGLSIYLKRR